MFGMGSQMPGEFNPETGEFEMSDEEPTMPPEVEEAFADFKGAAVAMRFNDGAFEVEFAGNGGQASELIGDQGETGIAELPDDTVAAFGVAFPDGWVDLMVDQFSGTTGMSAEEMFAELSEASGLDLPADAETLLGESAVVSLGSGIDLDAVFNGGPADLPIGLTVEGDPGEIDAVVEKIRAQMGPDASLLETESGDNKVFISPNEAYRSTLADGGSLGDTDAFKSVVDGAENPTAVLFVNFDADDNWLAELAREEDPTIADNLEPLQAFGIAGWREGDVSHSLMRLTTN